MRSSGLWLVLLAPAACSSSASSASPDGGAPSDDGGALTCGSTVSAYCGANACQATLAGARQDKTLCPASITPCGDYDVIIKGGIDTTTTYYYFQSSLLAIGHTILPGRTSCLAGPSSFSPPSCTAMSQPLPACP